MKNNEMPSQRLQIKDAPPATVTLEQQDNQPKESQNERNH